MTKIRVLVADDHPLFLFALAHVVGTRQELELVGQAHDGHEALECARRTRPDIAVLDVAMPGLDGLQVLQAMLRDGLTTRVLFVSGALEADTAYQLVEAGASGVLEKDVLPDAVGDALLRIARGETVLAPSVHALVHEARARRRRPAVAGSERDPRGPIE